MPQVIVRLTVVVRLCGPAGWAQSTHWFSVYERDRAWRRVLDVTESGVAFWTRQSLASRSGRYSHGCRVQVAVVRRLSSACAPRIAHWAAC
ncbi:hypothetical protein Taro_038011 [Colocasia esculenta]|uniref:Uncharacterized protein n=1 Tax=Colocasia esculenta TaxID=4460 RepID=A0A843WBI4_COLES|nr:hypothetical protein [Colocasia esculenta]